MTGYSPGIGFWVAARLATSRPVPEKFTLNDQRGNRPNFSYFRVNLPDGANFIAREIVRNKGLIGVVLYGKEASRPTCLPSQALAGSSTTVFRYYRIVRLEYRSPLTYLAGCFLKLHVLAYLKEKALQTRYNKSLKLLDDRVELLHRLVALNRRSDSLEYALSSQRYSFDVWQLMSELYGERIVDHPEFDTMVKDLDFLLKSLHVSGDLEKAEYGYNLAPKALETLARFAIEQRRHEDQMRSSRRMGWLTAVVAVAAIVQTL